MDQVSIFYESYRWHFIVYCFYFFAYGAVVNALGPLFPYMAQDEGKIQTEYSILFIFRALGYLVGSLVSKMLQQKHSNHFYLILSTLAHSLACFMLTIVPSPIWFKCVTMLISGWACAKINMFLHACIIHIYRFGLLEKYLIIAHAMFGIGGLAGPVFVYLMSYGTYYVLIMAMIVGSIIFYKMDSPQMIKHSNLPKISKSPQEQQLLANSQEKPRQLSSFTIWSMCPIFMLAVGQQTIYSGWIPSYAVMSKYSTKEHATMYSSLFWVFATLFRILMIYVPGKSNYKLIALFGIGLIGSFASLAIIQGIDPQTGLLFSGLVFGLSTSILYALGLALPQEYGFTLTAKQSSNFILSSAFGEGILAVIAGQLMSIFQPNVIFYFLALMSVVGIINSLYVFKCIQNEAKQLNMKKLDEKQANLNQQLVQIDKMNKKQTAATSAG